MFARRDSPKKRLCVRISRGLKINSRTTFRRVLARCVFSLLRHGFYEIARFILDKSPRFVAVITINNNIVLCDDVRARYSQTAAMSTFRTKRGSRSAIVSANSIHFDETSFFVISRHTWAGYFFVLEPTKMSSFKHNRFRCARGNN